MTTQVHALTIGERIAYQFTLTAGVQDTNARFRLSNLTLDCEKLSFKGVSGDVNTVHICKISSTGSIGESVAAFVNEGELPSQPNNIPTGYARIVFNYFNPRSQTADFVTLDPGTYLLVPSAGYGPSLEVAGLVAVGNGVSQPRKFRIQTFATTSATRSKVIAEANNNLTITFNTSIIEQRRNSISGKVESTRSSTTSYLPILTMGLRKVFRGKTNVVLTTIPTIDTTINVSTIGDTYPDQTTITNISTSMTSFKTTYGSHGIDYIFSTTGGKHMMGTQKQFIMLNGRIQTDTDTSFNQSADVLFTQIEGTNIKKANYIRENQEYNIFLNDEGYGVMYNPTGNGDYYITEDETNIESIIVPFGFQAQNKVHNFIAGWDGNIMGVHDNCMTFIHRTGWFTEQNLNVASAALTFEPINLDLSGVISTDSLTFVSNSVFDNSLYHVYVHDTSLYANDAGYASEPIVETYIDPNTATVSFGLLIAKTTIMSKKDETELVTYMEESSLIKINNLSLLTPSLNFVDTILDTSGHVNPEVKYLADYTSQQWVMSNAYDELHDNSFGYPELANTYDAYELGTVEVIDEIAIPDNVDDIITEFVPILMNSYMPQNYILDITGAVAKHTGNGNRAIYSPLYDGTEDYGIRFTALKDAYVNVIKVYIGYVSLNNSTGLSATLSLDNGASPTTFTYAFISDQELVLRIPNSVGYYHLAAESTYKIVLHTTLAALSSYANVIESNNTFENYDDVVHHTIFDSVITLPETFNVENLQKYSYDSFADNYVNAVHAEITNPRNAPNNDLQNKKNIERNLTIKAKITKETGQSSYVDISFDTCFSPLDFNTNGSGPSIQSITVCGEDIVPITLTYDDTTQKFKTSAISLLEHDEIVPIKIRYESVTDSMPDIFRHNITHPLDIDVDIIMKTSDVVSVINMGMMMSDNGNENPAGIVRWWGRNTGNDIYQGNSAIYYDCGVEALSLAVDIAGGIPSYAVGDTDNALSMSNIYVKSQSFLFKGMINIDSTKDIRLATDSIETATALYLLFNAKMGIEGHKLYLNNGYGKTLISSISLDSNNVILIPVANIIVDDAETYISLGSDFTTDITTARDSHFFIADDCVVTDNVLKFKARDPVYMYDLFTIAMTGNVLYHLVDSGGLFTAHKYLVHECWIEADDSESYVWAMRLVLLKEDTNDTSIDTTPVSISVSVNYFYLKTPLDTTTYIQMRLPVTKSTDIFTGYTKLTSTLPDFGTKDDLILTTELEDGNSTIVSDTPTITYDKLLSVHEKSYVTAVESINNATLAPLISLGTIKQEQHALNNLGVDIYNGTNTDDTTTFGGYETTISLTLDMTNDSYTHMAVIPVFADERHINGINGILYDMHVINNASTIKITCYEPGNDEGLEMSFVYSAESGGYWLLPISVNAVGVYKFKISGAASPALMSSSIEWTPANASPSATYRETFDSEELPLISHANTNDPLIPQISIYKISSTLEIGTEFAMS